jgi:uncharacterized RDD family membrane protein YckC
MADERRNGEPPATELVYLPEPSWQPMLIAFGLAAVIASLFTWWPYGVIGAIIALLALRSWIVDSTRNYEKLPRRQRVATSVIPAVPLERD